MTQETKKPMSLASKLAAIGKEIGAVDKSGKNAQQNYNYIEYGVVAGRIRELFDKYHMVIVPSVENVNQDEVANKYGGKGYHYLLEMSFTIVNGEDVEDKMVSKWVGEATDYGDKGINKAETAGTKYFLMRLFNVSEKGETEADAETPAQMTETRPKTASKGFNGRYTKADVDEAKTKLAMAKDIDELKLIYAKLGGIMLDKEIVAYKNELKEKIGGESE
jgi:hypothetical protein